MDILAALRQEEGKLQHELKGIQIAIAALNGSHSRAIVTPSGVTRKRNDVSGGPSQDFKGDESAVTKFRAESNKAN
jgi:hypothetical protein